MRERMIGHEVIEHVWANSALDTTMKCVLVRLACATSGEEPLCLLSMSAIANDCRMSTRQIQRVVLRLERSGYLAVTRGAGRSNLSQFRLVPDAIAASAPIVKGDICDVKGDMGDTLSSDKYELKGDIQDIKGDIQGVKGDMGVTLSTDKQGIKGDICDIKGDTGVTFCPDKHVSTLLTKSINNNIPKGILPKGILPKGILQEREIKGESEGENKNSAQAQVAERSLKAASPAPTGATDSALPPPPKADSPKASKPKADRPKADRPKADAWIEPTIAEVADCFEGHFAEDHPRIAGTPKIREAATLYARAFIAYYSSAVLPGERWRVGKNPMKNWRQAVAGWYLRDKREGKTQQAVLGPRNFSARHANSPQQTIRERAGAIAQFKG